MWMFLEIRTHDVLHNDVAHAWKTEGIFEGMIGIF